MGEVYMGSLCIISSSFTCAYNYPNKKGPKVKPKNSAMWSLLITELMLEPGKSL